MWIYFNETSNRQSVVVPHGQVVRQNDGFDIYLAFDNGTIAEKGYTSFTLQYKLPSESTSRLFGTLTAVDAEEIVFEKLNDSEVPFSLRDGQTYDVIHFRINPGDVITSEDGDLRLEFSIIKTAGSTNTTLTSVVSVYVEPSLDYLGSLALALSKTEAEKILDLIYRNIYAITATWDKVSSAPVVGTEPFLFRSVTSRGITSLYGYCTLSTNVSDFTLVATTTAENRELSGTSFIGGKIIGGNEDVGTDREGLVKYNSQTNRLEFYVGPGKAGDKISFNGILFINYTGDFSEQTAQQTVPYIPMTGSEAIDGPLTPGATNSHNLGASNKQWNRVYTKELTLGGTSLSEAQLQALLELIGE